MPFSLLVRRFPCGCSCLSPRNTIAEIFYFTRFVKFFCNAPYSRQGGSVDRKTDEKSADLYLQGSLRNEKNECTMILEL